MHIPSLPKHRTFGKFGRQIASAPHFQTNLLTDLILRHGVLIKAARAVKQSYFQRSRECIKSVYDKLSAFF